MTAASTAFADQIRLLSYAFTKESLPGREQDVLVPMGRTFTPEEVAEFETYRVAMNEAVTQRPMIKVTSVSIVLELRLPGQDPELLPLAPARPQDRKNKTLPKVVDLVRRRFSGIGVMLDWLNEFYPEVTPKCLLARLSEDELQFVMCVPFPKE